MTRTVGVLLVALLVTPCAAQWTGTIASRPVTCTIVPGPFPVAPMGGDAAVVTTLGLWCRGTRRHAVQALVYATDRAGTLALTGHLCRRGPRTVQTISSGPAQTGTSRAAQSCLTSCGDLIRTSV